MMKQYFQAYNSQEDDDYNPTKLQEVQYDQEHKIKNIKNRTFHQSVQCLWEQIYQQEKQLKKKIKKNQQNNEISNQEQLLQIAKQILNNEYIKPDKHIIFAGKQFILDQNTGQLLSYEGKNSNKLQKDENCGDNLPSTEDMILKQQNHIAYQYLNHIVQSIHNRSRKINSVIKSKLDWRGFVKQEGIQDKLKYNRKGGVIPDMEFIKKRK